MACCRAATGTALRHGPLEPVQRTWRIGELLPPGAWIAPIATTIWQRKWMARGGDLSAPAGWNLVFVEETGLTCCADTIRDGILCPEGARRHRRRPAGKR